MASSNIWKRRVCLTLANFLVPVACLVFATGFFPYRPFLAGLATHEQLLAEEELGLLGREGAEVTRPARVFDKVIFMVVDALRRYVACRDEEYEQWRVSKLRTVDLGAG